MKPDFTKFGAEEKLKLEKCSLKKIKIKKKKRETSVFLWASCVYFSFPCETFPFLFAFRICIINGFTKKRPVNEGNWIFPISHNQSS